MCGHHALLPKALKVPVCYDQTGDELYRGGYADVWKGKYRDRDVAIKVTRIYSNDELQKIIHVRCSIYAYYVLLTTFCAEVLQRGCDVEIPSTSLCPATARCIDVRESVCNDFRVDVKWEHQSIR